MWFKEMPFHYSTQFSSSIRILNIIQLSNNKQNFTRRETFSNSKLQTDRQMVRQNVTIGNKNKPPYTIIIINNNINVLLTECACYCPLLSCRPMLYDL